MPRGVGYDSLAALVDYLQQEEEDQVVPLSAVAEALQQGALAPLEDVFGAEGVARAGRMAAATPAGVGKWVTEDIPALANLAGGALSPLMQSSTQRQQMGREAGAQMRPWLGKLVDALMQSSTQRQALGRRAGARVREAMPSIGRAVGEGMEQQIEERGFAAPFGPEDAVPFGKVLSVLGMAFPFVRAGRKLPTQSPYGPRAGADPVKSITEVDLRKMEPAEALDEARRGRHLKQDKTGQYIGGPRGVDTPDKLKAVRDDFDRLVEEGAEGADWYDRARGGVTEMAGTDPARQDLVASTLAQYSAQAEPDVNLGFGLSALNQLAAGQRTGRIRTGAMDDRYFKSVEETGTASLGPKTEVYEQKINPRKAIGTTGTNDIWHARGWGYVEKDGTPWESGLSPQQHAWLDAETVLAAGRANARGTGGKLDWDAASVQAAPWVAAKGKDLHRRFPKRFPTEEAGMEEAAKTYIDFLPKYTAYGTYERVPGAGTGHLEGLTDQPYAVREQYSRQAPSYADPETGRDIIYHAAGMPVRSTLEATGHFEGPSGLEINPANIARPMVSTESVQGTSGPRTVRSQDQELMSAVESTRAYIDAQNMGAWHKPIPVGQGASVAEATSFRVEGLTGPITEQQMRDLSKLVEPYGLGISDTGDGVTLMQFGESTAKEAKQFVEDHADDIAAVLPGAAKVTRVKLPSEATMVDEDLTGYFAQTALYPGPGPWVREGTGKATAALRQALQGQNIPETMGRLDADPRIREIVLGKITQDDAIAQQLNLPIRADIQRARQFIVEGGFRRLFEELDKGTVLPAIGIPLISLGLASRDNERR